MQYKKDHQGYWSRIDQDGNLERVTIVNHDRDDPLEKKYCRYNFKFCLESIDPREMCFDQGQPFVILDTAREHVISEHEDGTRKVFPVDPEKGPCQSLLDVRIEERVNDD